MNLVVISNEAISGGETNVLNRLFEAGLGCFHLRKCEVSADVLRAFLEEIAPQFHPRIVLHDHYELVREFALKGVHLNKRNLHRAEEYRSWINSVSAHIVEELTMLPEGVKYAFLSPIFHSISKVGYRGACSDEKLREARINGIIHHGVYALGGVCV